MIILKILYHSNKGDDDMGQGSGKAGNFKSVSEIKKARDKSDKARRDKAKRDGDAVRKQVKKSKKGKK